MGVDDLLFVEVSGGVALEVVRQRAVDHRQDDTRPQRSWQACDDRRIRDVARRRKAKMHHVKAAKQRCP
jgi:hypothetical protein